MKVLFVTYPMAFHTPGGGEVQLLAYKKHLTSLGVGVSLFDPWNPSFLKHDVVHFFSCIGGSAHFCNFVKQLGLPLVVSSSLWITNETRHLYPIDEIRTQLNLADRIITNSNIESETLANVLKLPYNKFTTIYNGVDKLFTKSVNPDLFRQHFKIQDRFVLNVGNIEPRKNQLMLVRAMKAYPEIKLVLIGNCRDQDYFEKVLSEGESQVIYLGVMEHNEILLSAYCACEFFCLPSMLETPGLAALEAGAQGARLLLTNEGSCSEYFGNSAQYVNPKSLNSLRAAIEKLLLPNYIRVTTPSPKINPYLYLWEDSVVGLLEVYNKVANVV